MKTRSLNKKERVELAAVAQTALMVCDELARAGHEVSDAPRLWLQMLVHSAKGDAAPSDMSVATGEIREWCAVLPGHLNTRVWRQWWRTIGMLSEYKRDPSSWVYSVKDKRRIDRLTSAVESLEEVLVRMGEDRSAANQRVAAWHEHHRKQFRGAENSKNIEDVVSGTKSTLSGEVLAESERRRVE